MLIKIGIREIAISFVPPPVPPAVPKLEELGLITITGEHNSMATQGRLRDNGHGYHPGVGRLAGFKPLKGHDAYDHRLPYGHGVADGGDGVRAIVWRYAVIG